MGGRVGRRGYVWEEAPRGEGSGGCSRKLRRKEAGILVGEEKDDGRCRPSKGKGGCLGSFMDE